MPQIINEEPGLGYRLGTGLGSGLSQALNNLTNLKFQELASRNQQMAQQRQRAESSALLQKFGLSPEASDYVSTLPPKEQWAAVQELSGLGALGDLQQQQAPDSMAQFQPESQETVRSLSSVLGDLSGGQAPRSVMDLLALPRQPILPEQTAAAPQAPLAQPAAPAQQQQVAAQPPVAQVVRQVQKPVAPLIKEVTAKDVKNPISPAEKLALKQQLQEQKAVEKELKIEQNKIDKETLPFYQDTIKSDSAAKKSNIRLNRLERLVFQDRLPGAGKYAFAKSLEHIPGIGPMLSSVAISALRSYNPDQEEFEKLSTDFIREAKDIFGARVTNQDLQAFMQIIPTLSQTDQGKLRVINNMRAFNKAIEVKSNAMKQIIKANGGKRPANLELLVEEYAKPELDKLSEEFTEGAGLHGRGFPGSSPAPIQQAVPKPVAAPSKALPSVIGSARRRAGL